MRRSPLLALVATLALLAATSATATPSIALQPGAPATFSLPGSSLTDSYFFDVGEGVEQVVFELSSGGQDVDLLVRYGTPFPASAVANGDSSYLQEVSHYFAISQEASERLTVARYNWQPARAGRWYVIAINYAAAQQNLALTASTSTSPVSGVPFEVVFDSAPSAQCDNAPWNDPSPRTPVGGNSGTTLGQQRRNAMLEAARRLSLELNSAVPVRIRACWTNAGGTANSATLASAGPESVAINLPSYNAQFQGYLDRSPWLSRNYTFFVSAPAARQAGTPRCAIEPSDRCANLYDIRIRFNDQIDGPALGNASFYYGFTAEPGGANVDFIQTAMHETTHGLGFIGFVNAGEDEGSPIGSLLLGYEDAFTANAVAVDSTVAPTRITPLGDAGDAGRAQALTSTTGLRWAGAAAVTSSANPARDLAAPDNYIRLYAPAELTPGSTYSHLTGQSASNGLMCFDISICSGLNPSRQLGIAAPMLHGVGWSPNVVSAPSTALPRSTQYFDPAHPGHGIDVQRAFGVTYIVIFYTFGASGEPEWYLASGSVIDGVFVPENNASGDSLVRYRYFENGTPPQQADPSVRGNIRLDFNGAGTSPACRDGRARDTSSPLTVMTWSIGDDRNIQWCMQSIIPTSLRTTPDFTGSWYAGADSGWGFSLLNFASGANNALLGLLYYPDVNGNGRWAYVQTENPTGGTLTLKERRGYCRTCAVPPGPAAGQFTDVDAGTIGFVLTTPSDNPSAGNRTTLNVTYQTAPGGSFVRTDSPLILLSAPAE